MIELYRQALEAEPRAVVIDFGCAKEVGPDSSVSVASQFLHSFALEGNQFARAPELFIELNAAMREVSRRTMFLRRKPHSNL
jgi:hypothetical protein